MAHAFRIEPTEPLAPAAPRQRLVPVTAPAPCRPRPDRAQRRGRSLDPVTSMDTVIAGIRVRRGAPYARRRFAAVLVVVVVCIGTWTLASAVGSALGAPSVAGAVEADAASLTAEAPTSVVVRPGDTVWALAARLTDGDGDLRPVVDGLVEYLGTSTLTAGERIELPTSLGS